MLSIAQELEMVREENRQLKELLVAPPDDEFKALGITGSRGKLLGMLVHGGTVTRELAMYRLYGGRPECDTPDSKIIEVMLSALRKHLSQHAIEIHNRFGVGWYITPEHKRLIKELCA